MNARQQTIDRYGQEAVDQGLDNLKHLINNSEVSLRMSRDSFEKFLEEGYKTQHETGTSGGKYTPEKRRFSEEYAFGPGVKPIYAYLNAAKLGYRASVDGYGDIRVDLKDEVRNRSQVFAGDSLDKFKIMKGAPSPLLDPKPESLGHVTDMVKYKHPEHYVEVFVHGGLSKKDIKKVYLTEKNKNLSSVLDKQGIPYEVTSGNEYNLDDF